MKLYLLTKVIPYEGDTTLGVYATRDDAEVAALKWREDDSWNKMDDLWVHEHVLGADPASSPSAEWRVKK